MASSRSSSAGSRVVAASRVGAAALSAVVVLVTSAVLSPAGRGELAALQTAAVLLAAVGGGSLALGISVVVGRDERETRSVGLLALGTGALLALALGGLGALVAHAVGVSIGTAVATGLVAGALAGYGALQGLPIGLGRMRDYAIADVARAAVALAAVAAGMAAGVRSPGELVAVWGAGALAGAAPLARLARTAQRTARRWRATAAEAVRRSLRAHPTNLVGLAVARLDIVVLAAVSTRPQVAYYSLAVTIAEAAWLLPGALAVTSLSDYVRLAPDRAHAAARSAVTKTVTAAGATGLVAGAAGVVVILAFLPQAYHASLAPLWIVLAGTIPYSVGHVASPFLVTAADRPAAATAIAAATLVVDLALLTLLGGPLGAIGAAVASTAAYALNGLLNVRALAAAGP